MIGRASLDDAPSAAIFLANKRNEGQSSRFLSVGVPSRRVAFQSLTGMEGSYQTKRSLVGLNLFLFPFALGNYLVATGGLCPLLCALRVHTRRRIGTVATHGAYFSTHNGIRRQGFFHAHREVPRGKEQSRKDRKLQKKPATLPMLAS